MWQKGPERPGHLHNLDQRREGSVETGPVWFGEQLEAKARAWKTGPGVGARAGTPALEGEKRLLPLHPN